MPSPFPGMNPYLEQDLVWQDFHESFMPLVRSLLMEQLDDSYVVKIDEHIFIHEPSTESRTFIGRGDVDVTRPPWAAGSQPATGTLEAPAQVELPVVDEQRLSFLEVRDRADWKLITVIELLSPANKYAGPDREQYIGKRSRLLFSTVHLVEIDLLRGGPRLPLLNMPECDYYVLVSRMEQRPRAGFWPIQLRDRLPVIPIPLRTPEEFARLDLQDVLNRIYDAARYEGWIYRSEPQPRLRGEDAEWAAQFVPRAGMSDA
jgi:Protein of unknown function (DUF4058)